MFTSVRYLIFGFIAFTMLAIPYPYEASSQETPSISEFNNCVSFFTRKLSVRERNCRWFEFEVSVEGGGEQGPPGPAGEDGLDVMDICMDQEVLLANGTCLDLSGIVPGNSDCPCFDSSDILGQGIDYMAEMLSSVVCGTTRLGGNRPDGQVFNASVQIGSETDGTCFFTDESNGIALSVSGISQQEAQACLDIILNSQMWALNCAAQPM